MDLTELRKWMTEEKIDPLVELAKWDRKYYSFEISGGPHYQPGDGYFVILMGGGRKVQVSDYEDVTLGELILIAIKKWHEDKSVKTYRAIAYWTPGQPSTEPIKAIQWQWVYINEHGGQLEYHVEATSELEALRMLEEAVPTIDKFYIWEIADKYKMDRK